MGPIKTDNKQKPWSQLNKSRKEAKKKRKTQNLISEALEHQKNEVSKSAENLGQEPLSTLSIAVPGSILENAQSLELRTYLAGQIARAACIFQVDEVVIFDDYSDQAHAKKNTIEDSHGPKTIRECCVQFGRILQYLECPAYLRKHFFPLHRDLKFSGVLNPLNAPHHLKRNEKSVFREGVVMDKLIKEGRGSLVNAGLLKEVRVDKVLTPGIRCTVKLDFSKETRKKFQGTVVSPLTPRKETGIYWGYSVRLAHSLSKVFSQCPYKNGYDLTIGTSDKGTPVDDLKSASLPYEHLLIVFGGVQGLECALETDEVLQVDDPKLLFDHYLNTVPGQGSKTIRTEEAVLLSLAALRPKLSPKWKPKECPDQFANLITETQGQTERHDTASSSNFDHDDMSRFD